MLDLGRLDIENCCNCDSVEVFDGQSYTDVRLGSFFSNEHPPTIFSSTESLFIRFSTDQSIVGQGFNAEFVQSKYLRKMFFILSNSLLRI